MKPNVPGRLSRAERASFKVMADCIAETIGFGIPLHKAAERAFTTGLKAAESEFYELILDLPAQTRDKLLADLQKIEARKREVARRYVKAGKV